MLESGTPDALMGNPASAFYGMVAEGGDKNVARVREILGTKKAIEE